jgi:hypothetical protein
MAGMMNVCMDGWLNAWTELMEDERLDICMYQLEAGSMDRHS